MVANFFNYALRYCNILHCNNTISRLITSGKNINNPPLLFILTGLKKIEISPVALLGIYASEGKDSSDRGRRGLFYPPLTEAAFWTLGYAPVKGAPTALRS